jgi:DNA-binding MarR family transcriptional regulator
MSDDKLIRTSFEIYLHSALLLKYFSQALETRLKAYGANISSLQHGILGMLQFETLTVSELSQRLGLDPSTLVRAVDSLERKGLAQRGSDPKDRRRNPIHITPKGQTLAASVPVIGLEDLPYQAIQSLGVASAEKLSSLLREVILQFPEGRMVAGMVSSSNELD